MRPHIPQIFSCGRGGGEGYYVFLCASRIDAQLPSNLADLLNKYGPVKATEKSF